MPRDVPVRFASPAGHDGLPLADAEQLRHLYELVFPVPQGARLVSEDDLAPLCDPGLLTASVDEVLARHLPSVGLRPCQRGRLEVARRVLSDYLMQPVFHPQLRGQLAAASAGVFRVALANDDWCLRRNHALTALLDRIGYIAQGWDPEAVAAPKVAEVLAHWFARLESEPVETVLADSLAWLERNEERLRRVMSRVAAQESGAVRMQSVREQAARQLSRQVAGRPLPDFMVRCLMDNWLPGLQWILIQQGDSSDLWQQASRLLGLTIWSIQRDAGLEENRNKFQRVLEQLQAELPGLLEAFIHDAAQRDGILQRLDQAHCALQAGDELVWQVMPALDGTALVDQVNAEVSEDLIREVERLSESSWFSHHARQDARMTLLIRDDLHRQLVFANPSGARVFACSFEQFAWHVSAGEITPVPSPKPTVALVAARLTWLADRYSAHRDKVRQRRTMVSREEARQKALAEARRLAELERAQEQELLALQAREAEQAHRRQRARIQLGGLVIGAWLDFAADDGSITRRRLAVMLPSSGKFVFVDKHGHDKVEMTRERMVDGLASGMISLVEQDARFNDALDRIMDSVSQ